MPNKPLRVLQLGSPNGMYGAERWILALVKYLDPSCVHTIIGVVNDEFGLDPPLLRYAQASSIETMAIEAPGRFNLHAVGKLREFIRSNQIDVLHTHFYKTDVIGLMAVRGTRCRIVTTPHGWSVDAGFALKAYEAFDRQLFRFFDAVVPLSPELMRELRAKCRDRLRLILNGVDVGEIDSAKKDSASTPPWNFKADFVVGYIGQLIARKGVDALLTAFAQLRVPNAHLVIIGDGDLKSDLKRLAETLGIAARTHFLGYREDRLALLRRFNVLALPSKLEGIPRCIMEAMASYVPVVASDIPGPRELIENEVTGLLVESSDAYRFASAMSRFADAHFSVAVADRARKLIVDRYSATAMSRQYTALYESLCSTAKSGLLDTARSAG